MREYPSAPPTSGHVEAGSDAAAVQWCEAGELGGLDVTEGLESMVRRVLQLDAARRRREEAR